MTTHQKNQSQQHAPSNAPAPIASFEAMTLIEPLKRVLKEENYTTPTPIQGLAIAPLLVGRDLIGVAQTGTGKTAAFTLPLLQYLTTQKRMPSRGMPRSLILAPTRELAAQIGQSIHVYGRHLRLTHTVIFGGVGQGPQVQALQRGIDILVATPGRLLDLMNQGHVRLDGVEVFVLDEADRMLDMGFMPDIRRIIPKLPHKRQNAFFSATMEPEVRKLAMSMVHDAVEVSVTPEQPTVERIAQSLYFVGKQDKDALLLHLLEGQHLDKVVVFTKMKHMANKVAQRLSRSGVRADAIHGNKSQTARTQALDGFRSGRVRVLVATDIAARGLDIDGVTHVINYDLPMEPETYVHRIGRTARAGADGDAISFCSPDEKGLLRDVERLIKKQIPLLQTPPLPKLAAMPFQPDEERPRYGGGHGGGHGRKPAGGGRGGPRSSGARPAHAGGPRGYGKPSHARGPRRSER